MEKPEVQSALGHAERQLYLNHYEEAAIAFQALADQLPSPHRQKMQLKAADAWYQLEAWDRFESLLQQIDRSTADLDTRKALLWMEVNYFDNREAYPQVLQLLDRVDLTQCTQKEAIQLFERRITIYSKLEDPLNELNARVKLLPYLDRIDQKDALLEATWQLASTIDFNWVAPLMVPPPDDFGGWVELIYFLRYPRMTQSQLSEDLQLWQLRYPNHPALLGFEEWLPRFRSHSYDPPRQIALLLPCKGRLRDYGDMIRDGFISGYLDSITAAPPAIRVYPLGDDPAEALTRYRQAVEEGADFVVGPLDKTAFELLVNSDEVRTPLIGLNYLSSEIEPPPALFQFGLLPEDESREVARRAWEAGHRHALVLTADNELGSRHAEAFTAAFVELGGKVATSTTYPSSSYDFSAEIVRLLNLNRSRERHRQLVNILGSALQFEPRARTDIDFIFVYATPQTMRLIRPQLKFHRATQLPVYSPARTYTGTPNPQLDHDLDGVWFVETPWILSEQKGALQKVLSPYWSERFSKMGNFFALGYDTARLIQAIPMMLDMPDHAHTGLTGRLSLDENNAIRRQLDHARFIGGQPKVLP